MKVLLLSLLLMSSELVAQTIDSLKPIDSGNIPVTYGQKNDHYPDSILVQGIIRDTIPISTLCGVNFWSGTIEIELTQQIENYSGKIVFVIVPCFSHSAELIGKSVSLNLKKTYNGYAASNLGTIINSFDSEGIPFYHINIDDLPTLYD